MADIILTGASWVSVIALWTSAASVYVSPAQFRLAGLAGLAFPIVLGGTLFTLFLTILFAPRRCWITLLGMLLSFGSIRSFYPINPFQSELPDSTLRVISYNTHSFYDATNDEQRKEVLQYLASQNADIFCYQEGSWNFPTWSKLDSTFTEQYPYIEVMVESGCHQGICSRYPVTRSQIVTRHTGNAAVAFWLSMPKGDSLLVVNCHLQSNQLTPEDRTQYSDIVHNPKQQSQRGDSVYATSRHLAGKVATSAAIRALMADTIATFLGQHPAIPTIVCGDFNDTPISYSTFRIKRCGFSDAFRMVGNGWGRSFNKDAIAVRIDHQFCSDHFQPVRAHIDNDIHWSDHYPIIASYVLRE